jgi:hypothetical protein
MKELIRHSLSMCTYSATCLWGKKGYK